MVPSWCIMYLLITIFHKINKGKTEIDCDMVQIKFKSYEIIFDELGFWNDKVLFDRTLQNIDDFEGSLGETWPK